MNKFESIINAANALKESRNKVTEKKGALITSYYIAVTAIAPHDITNQRYFTGKGISGDPRDAKTYDSEEAARADFKKIPDKFDGNLIRDARVIPKYSHSKESKKLKEDYDDDYDDYDDDEIEGIANTTTEILMSSFSTLAENLATSFTELYFDDPLAAYDELKNNLEQFLDPSTVGYIIKVLRNAL